MRSTARKNPGRARKGADPLDPHKDAVYAWEDEWWTWNHNLISVRECRRLIETACAHYGVKPPAVVAHYTRALSFSIPSAQIISLQAVGPNKRGGLNAETALHEAAHHIVWFLCGERPQDHGRTFLGILMWLLEKAEVAPVAALHATAREHGLKWRHLPPTIFSCKSRAA